MSITATKPPALVSPSGHRLKRGVSAFSMLQGAVSTEMRRQAKVAETGDDTNAKRAKLMLAAKANLHFSDEIERGVFTIIDPSELEPEQRTEAEAAGFTSKTLVLHPDDLDRAIEQFSAAKKFDA